MTDKPVDPPVHAFPVVLRLFDHNLPPRLPACSMVLPGLPEQAAVLRSRLRDLEALPAEVSDTVELLATELFANAIRHTRSGRPGGTVAVTVCRLPGRLQVRITDDGPLPHAVSTPHIRPPDLDREGGLGLLTVHRMAARWGTAHDSGRTTVWFDLDIPLNPVA